MQGYIDGELGVSEERGVVSARCEGPNGEVGQVEKECRVSYSVYKEFEEGGVASTGCKDP